VADLSQYDDVFQAAGNEWNVDPTLLKAVAAQESGGNTGAVSLKNAQGLMQITPDTQKYLGVTDPTDPVQSIYGAAKYLSEGLDKEGSPEGALLYYHGGPGWRQAFGPESAAYVPGVTRYYQQFSKQAPSTDQPPPADSQSTQAAPMILGDSLASKGGLGGSGVVGAQPSAIRSTIAQAASKGAYQGQPVVLSSGASNAPGDMTNIEAQLDALKNGGASGITLLGVGPGVESKAPGTNAKLEALAQKYGAQFVPLPAGQMSGDGVHPTGAGYKTLLAAATPKTMTDATPAPAGTTGPGKGPWEAMASDDLPSWLPAAPKAATAPSSGANVTPGDDGVPTVSVGAPKAAASDGLPSWLPAAPKAPPQALTAANYVDQTGGTAPPEAAAPAWMSSQPIEPLKRVAEAGVSGWQNTPPILSSGAENFLNTSGGPIGRYITVPATKIAGGILGAGAAVGGAIGQGAYELGNALDPRLGRDLYMLNQVAPAALAGVPGAATPPWMTPDAARAAAASRETALAPPPASQFGKTGGPPVDIDWLTRAVQEADQSNLPASAIPSAAERAATREAATPGAAPGAVGAAVAPSGGGGGATTPTTLNASWLRQAGANADGSYNMGKGGAALVQQAQDALSRGDTVQLMTDGGRKTVNITGAKNGIMVDDKGQPWGSMSLATDQTGKEGLRITPAPSDAAATPGAAPGAVGAAVTMPGAARLTPDEVNAYRATAEGKKLLENQVVGEPDRNAYIPGSNPNMAEQEQTVNSARELKSLGITSAEASNEAKLAAQTNNDARKAYWEDTAKSPVDVQKAEAARDEQAQADLKATWANKTDADAQPVLDTANAIKASPDGRRPAVRSAVDSITSELTDADGNLITDPEQLYGVRKHIGDLLSKEGQRETPLAARATDNLIKLRDSLDGVIEAAAPGFKQYLQNFSDASKPIDEMQVLQDTEPKLFRGPQSTMTYSDFQRFMKNVVDMRNAQGVNPYKSISDDTMQRLWNLRDDLRRSAGAQELARAPGSDTASNIIDAIKQYGKLGGSMAMDAAAAHMFGPVAGPVISRGLRAVTAPIVAQRTARAQMGRMRQMLYPSHPLSPSP
jgi:hypothetical protein